MPRSYHPARLAGLILAAGLAMPAFAQDGNIPWISGGVGDEEAAAIRGQAANYNLHVLFANRQGSYLAGTPFTIANAKGNELHSGTSQGPLLYVRLPPGSYKVSAMLDGRWRTRDISLGKNDAEQIVFVADNE